MSVAISLSRGSSWPRDWTQVYAPIYIPTNSARGLPICHILTNACLFDNSHSDGCEVIAHCGLVLHFTITSNVEHLFVYLLTIFIFPLEKSLLRSCAHLFIGFFVCLFLMCCMSSFYIFYIKPLSDILFANIFSHSLGFFFIFWWFPSLCKSYLVCCSFLLLPLLLFPSPEETYSHSPPANY